MTTRRLGHIAILVAVAAVLTGCGVVAGPRQTVLPEPPSAVPQTSAATPTPALPSTPVPSAPSAADGAVVCGGGSTDISGADQEFVLTGDCPSVTIGGAGLRVDASQAALGVVQLSGDRNELRAADISTLSVGGQDNIVDARMLSTVALNGDRNALTAAGFTALTVSGNDNSVRADSQGAVTDNGQRNTVTGR
jgi:hypothetical protein